MAESIVNVTEGAGKKLHTFNRTIGANSVEDEVVIQGESYLAGYICSMSVSGAISTATAASHTFQVMAGASLKVRVRRIQLFQMAMATTAAMAQVNVMRLTTAGTGGTVNSLSPLDTTDSAAGATFMTLPTVKGTEGAVLWIGSIYMMQTIGASAQLNQPILDLDFERLRTKPIIIPAGTANGICFKWVTAIAAGTVWANVWIDESNF